MAGAMSARTRGVISVSLASVAVSQRDPAGAFEIMGCRPLATTTRFQGYWNCDDRLAGALPIAQHVLGSCPTRHAAVKSAAAMPGVLGGGLQGAAARQAAGAQCSVCSVAAHTARPHHAAQFLEAADLIAAGVPPRASGEAVRSSDGCEAPGVLEGRRAAANLGPSSAVRCRCTRACQPPCRPCTLPLRQSMPLMRLQWIWRDYLWRRVSRMLLLVLACGRRRGRGRGR